jgi:predicted metal-dependent RNase
MLTKHRAASNDSAVSPAMFLTCCQGPCVLFATPGMLQGGTSLEVFKAWAPDPQNLVLLPSYQVNQTKEQTFVW